MIKSLQFRLRESAGQIVLTTILLILWVLLLR